MRVIPGDSRTVLPTLADNSIDSVVTDPPYALVSILKRFGSLTAAPINNADEKAARNGPYQRASKGFMGKTWDTGEVAMSAEFWAEVYRVLKPGAFVAAFGATRGYHRMACAIEDAGFEIRDSLMWLYGTGFPKSHNVSKGIDQQLGAKRTEIVGPNKFSARNGKVNLNVYGAASRPDETAPATDAARQWQGWGTALKPAFEPIVLARKPLSEGTVAANVLRWRTGALNIDACRIETAEQWEGRELPNAQDGVCWGGTLNASSSSHPLGRWPANIVHDGSDEVIGAFPSVKARGNKGASHSAGGDERAAYNVNRAGTNCGDEFNYDSASEGSAARFFYSAKASKADRNGSKHPTVKPVSLMQWLCQLVTPPGGVVLDPFAGTGTTGAAAAAEGFDCILIEREAEYLADIQRRFAPAFPWNAP